jgi:hypothetical protein
MDMERKKFDFKKNITVPVLLLLMALVGCSGVKSEMDKSADLRSFKSFAWKASDIKTGNPLYKGDIVDKAIKENVESELAQKGLSRNDENPDVYIQYHTYSQSTQQPAVSVYGPAVSIYGYTPLLPAYTSPLGYSYGYGDYAYGHGFGYPPPYIYTQETLIIDLIDAKTNKVIWRGSTERNATDAYHIDKQLAKEVHDIMKKYSENSEGKMVKHHVAKHNV